MRLWLKVVYLLPLFILVGVGAQEQRGPILQGRVVNESDQPVAGATVTIFSEDALVQTLYTSPEGVFTSVLPRPGQYNVVVNLDGFRPYTELLNLPREETIAYTFQLLPSSLHVVVLDVLQEKLSDAVVTVKGEDGVLRRAIESPKGDYYFGRLKPGIYQLTVSMPGYELAVDDGVYIPPDSKTMLRTQLLLRASPIPMADKKKERYLFPVIPANQVSSLMQDTSGVIWAGTARGVARFISTGVTPQDGQAQIYAVLDGLEVRQILQQSDGTYWFLTASGLYYRKPWGRICEPFQLPGRQVRAIAEDRYKAIWIATDYGLLRYQEGGWAEYRQESGLPSNDVRCVIAERQGDGIWVGTAAGAIRIVKGQVQSLGEQASVVGLLEDSRGQVWILTETEVKRYDGKELVVLKSLPQPARVAVEDRLGNIWFAGAKSSVYVYDMLRDEVGEFYQSDHILSILSDREGNVWFGSENGLIYQDFYSFVSFNTSRGLQATDVHSLLPDPIKPGGLWVGTLSGLIYYNGISFQRVAAISSELAINYILAERDGTLWVATSNGLFRLSAGVWTRFGIRDGLPGNDVKTLCEDVRGTGLWVATSNGVSYFRPSLQAVPVAADHLQIKAVVRHIYQQRSAILWFATDKGVYRYNPTTYDLTIIGQNDGLESIDVRWIDEDPKSGLLLFATGKGIEFSDGRRVLTGRQPPALSGDGMNVIYRDKDGMFWFGAEDGKIRKFLYTDIPEVGYNGALLVSYSPDRYDIPGTSIRSIAQDSTGAIWFATDAGLVRHLPTRIAPSIDCRLEVNGAERFSNEIEAGRHNIKFRFWAISATGETGFVYRIVVNGQGWDYHWVSPQAAMREAVFNGLPEGNPFLPEGEHVFEVRAINRDLYFSQPLLFHIRIDKPFWKKRWFHALLAILLTLGVFMAVVVHRYQKREYTLPPHLRTFQPIDPNPYIAGNPIRNPSMFFGREDDFNYARIKLEGAAQGGVVLVFCGERRAGKSSILYQIVNGRLGERFIPVFIDLQEMVISSDHEFFGRMAKLIAEAVEQHLEREVPELDRTHFQDRSRNAFHLFSDFISAALAVIADRRLVILMDEYELLENKVEEGRLSKEVFNFLASIIESRDRLSFIFTGSRRLEERDRRYWREMLRRSLFRKVSFLSERDTLRLITLPVEGKVVYGRGVKEGIQRLTNGQPFYTQYICQSIVDHLNEWRRNYILKEDLDRIVEEIVDNPLPQMLYFWEGFSGDEKLVMSLLAEVLDGADTVATAGKIVRVIERQNYPVMLSENSIRLTLEELVRGDVLKRVGEDGYCFRIDLFRLWIRKSHTLWRVVREMVTV